MKLSSMFSNFKKEYFEYILDKANYSSVTINITKNKIAKLNETELEKVEIINVVGPLEIITLIRIIIIQSISFPSIISTNSVRMRLVAGKRVKLFEFGLRRAQGAEAGLLASKYSCKSTFDSVSNVQAGLKYNLDVRGTSAHAYIMSYQMFNNESKISNLLCEKLYSICMTKRNKLGYNTNITELLSFCMFTSVYKEDSILLIDTYNILESGIPNVVLICLCVNEVGISKIKGIRLDSGNLANQSLIAKEIFEKIGSENELIWMKNLIVAASNDINESALIKFNKEGHKIDAFGIGTNLVTCQKQPYYRFKIILSDKSELDVDKETFKFNDISSAELNEYIVDVNEIDKLNLK